MEDKYKIYKCLEVAYSKLIYFSLNSRRVSGLKRLKEISSTLYWNISYTGTVVLRLYSITILYDPCFTFMNIFACVRTGHYENQELPFHQIIHNILSIHAFILHYDPSIYEVCLVYSLTWGKDVGYMFFKLHHKIIWKYCGSAACVMVV